MPKKFDDERPTQPDLSRFPCPECRDKHGHPTGYIVVSRFLTSGRYTSHRKKCPTCDGALTVSRDELEAFRTRGPT